MTEPGATSRTQRPAARPTRRQVLVTGGVVAAAAAVTAACGSSGGTTVARPDSTLGADGTLATSDVPVGGGVVLQARQVVVTQPTAGTFKAFSAICTHEGCMVTDVANGTISCPCHNGLFSATDGSVQSGPPPAPLAEVKLAVSGSTITLA